MGSVDRVQPPIEPLVDHALDKDHVVVLVSDKEGNVVRVGTTKMYASLIIQDAERQPWFKHAVIEGEETPQPEET